jgi:hypothetical protein
MSAVTYGELEIAFETVIERNRKGQTEVPCEREDLFVPAFFDIGEDFGTVPELSIVPQKLPFERCWIVTSYKGMGIVALAERMQGHDLIRPDYLWYPIRIGNHKVMITQDEMDDKITFIVDEVIRRLTRNNLMEVDSDVQARINRGRAKAKPDRRVNDLPPFIRVIATPPAPSPPLGGTHASPTGHERRGHWRTYRASGKRVWINETSVNGGSYTPRNYRMPTVAAAA